jgi:hypothetical protein
VTGEAVPRTSGGPGYGGGHGGYYYGRGYYPYGHGYGYGGFYPWGYGGFGLGVYYGYYDPWFAPWYGGGFYYPQYYPSGYYGYDGQVRLKVKPTHATVYVDGYLAGTVDDFDGGFQRLRIEPGPHRIEIRADGYETLSFEVRVLPDRTFTYEGDLKRIP